MADSNTCKVDVVCVTIHKQISIPLPAGAALSVDVMSTPTFRGYITDALPELQGQNIIIKTVPDNIISVDDLARVGGQLLVQVLSQADTDLCWNHFVG